MVNVIAGKRDDYIKFLLIELLEKIMINYSSARRN